MAESHIQPILDKYLEDYPAIKLRLRGDSAFATPDLYKQCEENGTSYVIRLKENTYILQESGNLECVSIARFIVSVKVF